MATITINDKTRITSDAYQWILQQRQGTDKEGNPVWKSIAYHTDLGALVNRHAQRVLRLSDAEGLAEILTELESICRELTSALNPIVTINPKSIEKRT